VQRRLLGCSKARTIPTESVPSVAAFYKLLNSSGVRSSGRSLTLIMVLQGRLDSPEELGNRTRSSRVALETASS
jgi:hypothetical protein